MLVLWDPTWSDRLWCVFELAAFLRSKVASEQVLLIRPTVLGPCSIALFIAAFVVMLPRAYDGSSGCGRGGRDRSLSGVFLSFCSVLMSCQLPSGNTFAR